MSLICNLCKYSANKLYHYNRHCSSISHLEKEILQLKCYICSKNFKSLTSYKNHKYNFHNNKSNKTITVKSKNTKNSKNNKTVLDNSNDINDKLNDIKNDINNVKQEIKEEIDNSKKEVVTVVNKAITKASSLIKYLMENHRSVPPLKRIKKNDCIPILRLDYGCPEIKDDYSLQKIFVRDYSKNMFISNIAKSILKMINYKESDKQPIYNTDSSRYNYVVKLTTDLWNEDKSGIKFTDYIIRPLLRYIRDLVEEYIENELEQVNMYKNNFIQNQIHVELKEAAYNLDIQLSNDYLIKPLLKELSPYLRFLQIELDELEKLEELTKIQDDLQEIIDCNNDRINNENIDEEKYYKHNKDISDYDSDYDNDNYIKKFKVRMI